MKFIIVFAFLAASAYADEVQDTEIDWNSVIPGFWEGRDPAFNLREAAKRIDKARFGRIVGGEIVSPNIHPYQAGLLIRINMVLTSLCGGSLISNRAVLTAATCIHQTQNTHVILGAHQLTANEPFQQRQMVMPNGYRIHGNYEPETFANNIAILILPNVVTITTHVQIAIMPPLGNTEQFAGELATVSGWGRTSATSTATSPVLRSVANPVLTNAVCANAIQAPIVFAGTLCLQTAAGRGTCVGDMGGPLTVARIPNRFLIGVASFHGDNCEAGVPAGFSRVTFFRQWIQDNMNP